MKSEILLVVGTRPQFIKATVVLSRLRQAFGLNVKLLHSGQHYDQRLSEIFFNERTIERTGLMVRQIESVIRKNSAGHIVVIGDTNTTLAGSLAAKKCNVTLSHIEAGMRSFEPSMPEETNRIVSDHLSNLLFSPTPGAVANLGGEGITQNVHLVGDVLYDVAMMLTSATRKPSRITDDVIQRSGKFVLTTVHRAVNTDNPTRLTDIVDGLCRVAKHFPVVCPLHPRTRAALERIGCMERFASQVRVLEPVGYLDMLGLVQEALHIITDSGGVQREAFYFRVPCTTLRAETEWVELLEYGWNRLLDPAPGTAFAERLLEHVEQGAPGIEPPPLYGNGQAAASIARLISVFVQ